MTTNTNVCQSGHRRPSLDPRLARVVGLLALSIFINYVDRGSLSIAAPLLNDQLGLSPSQLGLLLSSFFWTYSLFQIVSGWLVDRFDTNWVIAGGFLLWSAATAGAGFAHAFGFLLAMRLLLGIGESAAYPSYSKILAKHVPEFHRGRANSFIAAGFACGPAFGTLLGGFFMARFGWRLFFVALGLVGLLWLIPWLCWMPRGGGIAPEKSLPPPRILEILQRRSAWGTFAGLFALDYFLYFLITWMPFYLVRERHFSVQQMAELGGAAFSALAVSVIISGWLSDRWIAAGRTPTLVRKGFAAAGLTCAASIAAVPIVANPIIAILILFFSCIGLGLCSSNLWAITQTLAGPRGAGKWTGLQNFAGNLSGVVAPALTGLVLARTGHFLWAFTIIGGVAVAGAFVWIFVVGPVEEVVWSHR